FREATAPACSDDTRRLRDDSPSTLARRRELAWPTVKIEGMMLALLDIPADYTEEYNRWYDLDHMPEHVAKADVLMGRRYVAPRNLRGVAGVIQSEQVGGYPPYLTTYWFGGPLDMSSDQARQGWLSLDRRIVKAGRFFRPGRSCHNSRWRVSAAHTRPGCLVH